MIDKSLKEDISNIDWSIFNGPSMYNPSAVPLALHSLMELDNISHAEDTGNRVIQAIGNNHAGVYYPAALKAIDYIIKISIYSDNNIIKNCALAVLNDLYYFEPSVEGYNGCSAKELKEVVSMKLAPFSDELIEF